MSRSFFIRMVFIVISLLFTSGPAFARDAPRESNGKIKFSIDSAPTNPVDPEDPATDVRPINPTNPDNTSSGTNGPLSIDYVSSFQLMFQKRS